MNTYVLFESAKSRGLRGNMGAWVAWVIIFTWVVWFNFCYMGQNFRRNLKFFPGLNICVGQFLGDGSEKISIGAFTITY